MLGSADFGYSGKTGGQVEVRRIGRSHLSRLERIGDVGVLSWLMKKTLKRVVHPITCIVRFRDSHCTHDAHRLYAESKSGHLVQGQFGRVYESLSYHCEDQTDYLLSDHHDDK